MTEELDLHPWARNPNYMILVRLLDFLRQHQTEWDHAIDHDGRIISKRRPH